MVNSSVISTATGPTIGVDVGDTWSQICMVDSAGTVVEEGRVRTTARAVRCRFGPERRSRVVLEVGTHSPWLHRLLAELGHEVIVANPGRVRLIAVSATKHDRADAEHLARLGRIDPALLAPVRHRGLQAHSVPREWRGHEPCHSAGSGPPTRLRGGLSRVCSGGDHGGDWPRKREGQDARPPATSGREVKADN